MNQVMQKLQKMNEDEYSSFIRVSFGFLPPSPMLEDSEKEEVEWFDDSINDSQKAAIKFALASKEVALIHGPPGVSLSCSHTWLYLLMAYRLVKHIR